MLCQEMWLNSMVALPLLQRWSKKAVVSSGLSKSLCYIELPHELFVSPSQRTQSQLYLVAAKLRPVWSVWRQGRLWNYGGKVKTLPFKCLFGLSHHMSILQLLIQLPLPL